MTFEDVLAAWLVKQRWVAGKGRTVHDLAVVADTEIVPGDPGLRHLVVTVSHGATSDCYQLFVGLRARLPARLRDVRLGSGGRLPRCACAPACPPGCGTCGAARRTACSSTTACTTAT